MRLAPQTRIRQVKVLDPAGTGDDHTIAVGLARASAPVINLSLGSYTHDGAPPVATGVALAARAGSAETSPSAVSAMSGADSAACTRVRNAASQDHWPGR
jgi:hypothetical protein